MDTFAGFCAVQLIDELGGVPFPMAIMYPTSTPAKTESLGPYTVDVSMNATPQAGSFPLVLISHGSGGSHLVYRTLAHYLARHGFVVGMPEHPFNNRNNNSLVSTVENLVNRPRHLQTAINWFFVSEQFAPILKPGAVSIIGHSMGGYTALALAGGVPSSLPHESPDGQACEVSVVHDERVNAVVLLAPASVWFRKSGALSNVTAPILLLVGEDDETTPYEYHGQPILDGVTDKSKVQYRLVENAGHFSFLSPFPESMTNADFAPSQDAVGFNREEFLDAMNAEILEFLSRQT